MPNHVTHRMVVTGPQAGIDVFRKAFLIEKTETDGAGEPETSTVFDFNTIAPMPELIRNTESSSTVQYGLVVLGRTDIGNGYGVAIPLQEEVERYLSYPWVQEAGVADYEGLKALLLKNSPDCVAKAEVAVQAYEEHGHSSWYSWSIANWGTKWNAYSLEIVEEDEGRLEFTFDTAWSPPEPIFAALATRQELADLEITIKGFDEGWNFAFVASIKDYEYHCESVEPDAEIYEAVYGAPDEVDA